VSVIDGTGGDAALGTGFAPGGDGAAARVLVLSERSLASPEWRRRGMAALPLRTPAVERMLADPPAAIVLDTAWRDARAVAECWQVHDLLGVPIIAIAVDAPCDEVIALFERGADDVVTLPPDPLALSARVRAVLRSLRHQVLDGMPETVRLGEIEVDLALRLVRRPEGVRSLSPTEFNLFLLLLRAGGRACGRRELVTRIWGSERTSSIHYLRLYIRYLREKIEPDPARPRYILNVWGIGYRLARDGARGAAAVANTIAGGRGVRLPAPLGPAAALDLRPAGGG
jgi:two-component system KDP operon response regulator KdpE